MEVGKGPRTELQQGQGIDLVPYKNPALYKPLIFSL
jgi:hypothetical protein